MRATARLAGSPAGAQVSPPSSERSTPLPKPALFRSLSSPVPTQTTRGSAGDTATAPTEAAAWSSRSGAKVSPPFEVLNRPPVEWAR
jgi:hypothetical protein